MQGLQWAATRVATVLKILPKKNKFKYMVNLPKIIKGINITQNIHFSNLIYLK